MNIILPSKFVALLLLLISFNLKIIAQESKLSSSQKKDSVALIKLSKEILTLIKAKKLSSISKYFHPLLGVRHTPYSFIEVKNNVRLKPTEFQQKLKANKKLLWGNYDGSGNHIKLTIPSYYKRFVYDIDLLKLGTIYFNEIHGGGNSIVNIKEIYPDAQLVEFYCKGIDPKFEGMDWRSVDLVFKKYKTTWYLIAIVHNEWTI